MTDRSWFVAIEGKPAGPYPDQQFLGFIASGSVDRNTLVWTEGMSAWQRAGYVPGLFAPSQPPSVVAPPGLDQQQGRGLAARSGPVATQQGPIDAGNRLEANFNALPLFGRYLLYAIGTALIVTAPWAATSAYRWMVARIRVPGRPNLAFEGKAGDIWWAFVLIPLSLVVPFVGIFLSFFFSLLTIRWVVKNISSEGRLLPLSFTGGYWVFLGWYILLALSMITIIGWAWVLAAWTRWFCRNIAGATRTISFTGTGWQILWRTWVLSLVCSLIIPIPWMMRWYARWYVSQVTVG
jgi:hypothetical protein